MSATYYTLIFIKEGDRVLLGYKKRGLGKGKWNGFGGKLESRETVPEGAIRELFEESNLVVDEEHLRYLGVVTYNDNGHIRIVYIFTASRADGDLKETDEMKPEWFKFNNIPYHKMWPDSKFWLPLALKDRYLRANFTYNSNCKIYDYSIELLDIIPDLVHVTM